MALEHAILVALSERAGTGYELARGFDRYGGDFWQATHQQIYRVLNRMADGGWVAAEHVAQTGRPDKKVYTVTDAGRVELARWLAEPAQPTHPRDDLAVKIRGASFGDPAAVLAEVERHRAHHAERLAGYEAVERREFADPAALTGHRLHQYLTLRGGITTERGLVGWYDEVRTALRRDSAT
ncbi:PadR family transcriptional regulator [Actinokineospora globicatena]|uniref:PadR family transcriptional regulator n=1 Tax=Actinokineospora globicatena TaxID=103729 RepID=UPI0020A3A765|nr:PadR family transcriptional regulator [Actinokineospora globicatena]MCP2300707.1 DNA-binding transcriptional regulator, PadR family [Actinokineospora globicatena]GLW77668.1 PadR family transcriptional regulator [Actinokineospora globicatena]GLW84504.1 PadR family transcriptional regulator [Actinokineospora globicatena]